MSIFDEVAQPMIDLFTFEPDGEIFEHTERQWPEEINLPGTSGSRRCAEMYFADPDQAEGLLEVHLATIAERRKAARLRNRMKEKASRFRDALRESLFEGPSLSEQSRGTSGPEEALEAMVARAEDGDREGFIGTSTFLA